MKRGEHSRKGQVAMEYLLITGFAFAILMPVIIIFIIQSQTLNRDVTTSQVNKVIDEVLTTTEQVYYYGAPTTKTVRAYMPQYVQSITISGNTIGVTINTDGRDFTLSRSAITNLTGSMSPIVGVNTIRVEALYDGSVRITNT